MFARAKHLFESLRRSPRAWWLVKAFVTLALLSWLLSRADLVQLRDLWAKISAEALIGLVAVNTFGILVASLKWRLLLPEFRYGVLVQINLMAQFYSLIVPGQVGAEAAKAYRLGRGRRDAARVAASVVLDKITSLIAILSVGLAGAMLSSLTVNLGTRVALFGVTALCFGALVALRIPWINSASRAAAIAFRRYSPRVGVLLDRGRVFVESWHEYLERPVTLLWSFLIGVAHQIIYVGMVALVAAQMGVHLPVFEWLWILALVSVAAFAPVTVGGVGIREGTFVVLLSTLGVGVEAALAISLVLFALQLLMAVVGAIVHAGVRLA
jgi:glycosyltransferase 2 family protein